MARRDIVLAGIRIRQFRWVLVCPIRRKRKVPRGLWLKTTWSEPAASCLAWPDDGQLPLTNRRHQSFRLFLPRPSSATSSYNPSPWEISQAAARLVVSFSPVFLASPELVFNVSFRFQSGLTSPSRMSLCCWKTSGRPWRTFCSSLKVRKIRSLNTVCRDAHHRPQIARIPTSSRAHH